MAEPARKHTIRVALSDDAFEFYRQRAEAEHRPLVWQIAHDLEQIAKADA